MKKLFIAIALILALSAAKVCKNGTEVEDHQECPQEIELVVKSTIPQDPVVEEDNGQQVIPEKGVEIKQKEDAVQNAEPDVQKPKEVKKTEKEENAPRILPDYVPHNYRYNNMKIEYPDCKKDVLNLIGIEGSIAKAQEATPKERMFCHRNQFTCCNHKEIASLQSTFKEHLKEYNREVSVLEELLTAFRGPKFMEFYSETVENTSPDFEYCKDLAAKVSPDYWSFAFRSQYIIEIETLYNDIEKYIKRNIYWAANTVCSVCDPFNHQFFDMDAKTVKGNAGTCREILEEREFELRFARVYNSLIRPTALVMRCIANEEFKTKDEKKEAVEDELSPIEENQLNTLLEKFAKCYYENQEGIDSEKANCEELCDRKLGTFNTIVPIVKVARRGLSEIFKYLMGGEDSIEEYYKETKDLDFYLEKVESPISFLNSIEGKAKLTDLKWNYAPAGGLVVMTDHMQKKFYKFAPALTTALVALIAFLF